VKIRSFRAPRHIIAVEAQGRSIWRGIWALFRTHKLLTLGVFLGAAVLGAYIWPYDHIWLARLHYWRGEQEDFAHSLAWNLSTWGDYHTYNLPLVLAIWLYGVWTRSATWRRAAIICFFGATMAGLFDDLFRFTMGRPRPDAHMSDGFYGISHTFRGGYQSFPSGHAASVFGAATALLVIEFPLGLFTTAFALAVVWSRLELNRHYPSDVLVGSIIGIYFGLLAGWGAKMKRPSRRPPLDSQAGSS
jgi:membrane-associated phospholipid phosphatase